MNNRVCSRLFNCSTHTDKQHQVPLCGVCCVPVALDVGGFMTRMIAVVVILWLAASAASAQDADRWTAAEKAMVRLSPAVFSELPARLKAHLTRIGCSVPQSFLRKEPHNVIEGRFRRLDQTDWAVLCHRGGTTSLLVFWEGSPDKSEELGKSEDGSYLQTIDGAGTIGFSHAIGIVDKDYIIGHYEAYGGTEPPSALDHEGINDMFLEKASVVHYWHKGTWLELTGAD